MRPRTRNLVLAQPANADKGTIRVRLDARTIVLMKRMSSLDLWKVRFPNARVIDGGQPPAKVELEP